MFAILKLGTRGVYLCIRCSGIHRGMGTHISKIKSIDLDTWTPDQMQVSLAMPYGSMPPWGTNLIFQRPQSIEKWGNRRANLYWEAHLKAGHIPPEQYAAILNCRQRYP